MIKTDAVIIGAGPVGLFSVFELGIMGLNAHVIDNLDKVGGQCIELYPDKPIYDIPALPECTGESLTNNLLQQIKPFKTEFHLNQRVDKLEKKSENWIVTTNDNNQFETPNVVIAAGVGSFEPRKPPIKNIEKYEKTNLFFSVKDKKKFKDQTVCIFGGGDSALEAKKNFKIKSYIPLCADESFHIKNQLKKLIKQYKWVNIKPDKFGDDIAVMKAIKFAKKNKFKILLGCMVSSSQSIIPTLRYAKYCDLLDLDGAMFLKNDFKNGLTYNLDNLYYDKKFKFGYRN